MNAKKTLYGTAAALCALGAINAVNMDELKERQGIASEPVETGKAMICLCGAIGAGIMALGKKENGEYSQAAVLSQGDMKDAVVNGANNLQNSCADFMQEAKKMAVAGKENAGNETPFTVYVGEKQVFANFAAKKFQNTL